MSLPFVRGSLSPHELGAGARYGSKSPHLWAKADEFSRNLLEVKGGKWTGPVRSGYGLHLVFVGKRVGGRLPELKEVREKVRRDWTFERQKELKDAAYAKLRERYTVEFEKPEAKKIAEAGTGTVVR